MHKRFDPYKAGRCPGNEEFREKLLGQVKEVARPEHRGREVQETAVAKAEGVLCEELQRLGWAAVQLAARRKGDAHNLPIA